MAAKFQHAQASIIKSIRQVSLFREWLRLRGRNLLPLIDDFAPDSRAGDAEDLAFNEVIAAENGYRFQCRRAGNRMQKAFDRPLKDTFLDECLDEGIARAARPIWEGCISQCLPIYSIVPSADRDGIPVTLEHLYLPFSADGKTPTTMMASMHAFSTESRFQINGLMQQNTDAVPLHWAVVLDPTATLAPKATPACDDVIEITAV